MLYKIREHVLIDSFRFDYYPIFDSHINYGNIVWVLNTKAFFRKGIAKALRLMNFKPK